jgi:hypothetical protein
MSQLNSDPINRGGGTKVAGDHVHATVVAAVAGKVAAGKQTVKVGLLAALPVTVQDPYNCPT